MDLPPNLHISDLADKLVAQRCDENRSCPATVQGGARLVDAADGVAAVRVQALLSLQGVHHHGRGSPADLPGRQQVRALIAAVRRPRARGRRAGQSGPCRLWCLHNHWSCEREFDRILRPPAKKRKHVGLKKDCHWTQKACASCNFVRVCGSCEGMLLIWS